MYEQENKREKGHLAMAASAVPTTTSLNIEQGQSGRNEPASCLDIEQGQSGRNEPTSCLNIEQGQSGQYGPSSCLDIEQGESGQNGASNNQHLQNLPSSGGVGGGRSRDVGGSSGGGGRRESVDCPTCRRNFWTTLLQAVVKVSTIILAAFGLQSFQSED